MTVVLEDAGAVAEEGARRFVAAAREAIAARGRFVVALAGGSTPRAMYQRLASMEVEWERVEVCFGDERCVPPQHPDSNFGMAERALLGKVPARVHRIEGERADGAERYEALLRALIPDGAFDLVLLGMGADGHTASLFPGTPALRERERWVVRNPVEKLGTERVTLTFPIINAARAVLVMVCGADKAEMLRTLAAHPEERERYPVLQIGPQAVWLIDRYAQGGQAKP